MPKGRSYTTSADAPSGLRRLEIASRAGCDVAVVTTQPGSKSQENIQKHGFELLYTRAILVRQP